MAVKRLVVRASRAQDAAALQRIYAPYVLHSLATFEVEVPSVAMMAERRQAVLAQDLPHLVAEYRGVILGYAYVTAFRERAAFAPTVEHSIYVQREQRRTGVGGQLMQALIAAATLAGKRQMVAVIGDSNNLASLAFHASHGFTRQGTLRRVGCKFGRYVDVVMMQRRLGAGRGG